MNEMRVYEDALKMAQEEIEHIVKKGELDDKCLEYLDKLVDISKDIETIFAMSNEYGDNGYSQARRPFYSYDEPMGGGNSYQRRDSRGRYSNNYSNDYRNGGSYGRGGYSREGDMRGRLEAMMNEATTEREREAIRHALEQI